jgi:uncharacterized repeat protein (TIGR03803 family)
MTATLTTLIVFNGTTGAQPFGGLITDAESDLFGTTNSGGATGAGTVFEIANTATGYATTPITLVSFNSTTGAQTFGGLITDATGDLFGTTFFGGAANFGTVFEIVHSATGYATTPLTLVSFDDQDGGGLQGSLISDTNGDLFGSAQNVGGSSGQW